MGKQNIFIIVLSFLFATISYADRLVLGIFPYFDAAKLATLHKPLKDHLASSVSNEIRLVSAPNFKVFKKRTADAHYDILITAPHFGRDAQLIANYEWLAFTSNISHAVFVTHKDSGIKDIKQLEAKSIALPPKGSIVHHLAITKLEKNNINPNKNITTSIQKSHNNSILSAIHKKTDAAAFGAPTWARYKAQNKNELRMIGKSEDIPGFAIMVHKSVSEQLKKELKEGLFSFAKTKEGKSYFKKTGLKGVREMENKDIKLLDKYLKIMKK